METIPTAEQTRPVRFSAMKYRLTIAGVTLAGLVATVMPSASAAINFTPIQELLTAVVDLIPTFMDLVVAIAPLIVVIAVVGFITKFLNQIINLMNFS
jgi:uncharacterized membrane protein